MARFKCLFFAFSIPNVKPAAPQSNCSALSGKPIRPGQATDGRLLLPLERVRGGEEAPEFAVEIVYFNRGAKWDEKGSFKLALPSLDLPISRTGLLIYYPPLFRTNAEAGTLLEATYLKPPSPGLSEILYAGWSSAIGLVVCSSVCCA